jgi:hypothetical protein
MSSNRSQNSRLRTEAWKQRENREIAAAKSTSRAKSIPLPRESSQSGEESGKESDESEESEGEGETQLSQKSKQKVSREDWTYQLNVIAFCGKKCVYSKVNFCVLQRIDSKVKPQKLQEVLIRSFDREIETAVRHLMLKEPTRWKRDSTVATLFGTGMPKAVILIKDPLEFLDVEENLKDYWEKDIRKVRVEYKVEFLVEEPEKDSDVEEIESPISSKGHKKRVTRDSPTLVKKRRVWSSLSGLTVDSNCDIRRRSRREKYSTILELSRSPLHEMVM